MTDEASGVATTALGDDASAQPEAGGRGRRGGGKGSKGGKAGKGSKGSIFSRIGLFYRQVIAELRKVIWPTRNELVNYTIVALVFVSVMVAFVALLDLAFAKLVLEVFG